MTVDHRFEHAMPYAWGGYRFVCSCGQSGSVVDSVGAAKAEHERHAEMHRRQARVISNAIHQAIGWVAGDHGWPDRDHQPFDEWWQSNAGLFDEQHTLALLVRAAEILGDRQAVAS